MTRQNKRIRTTRVRPPNSRINKINKIRLRRQQRQVLKIRMRQMKLTRLQTKTRVVQVMLKMPLLLVRLCKTRRQKSVVIQMRLNLTWLMAQQQRQAQMLPQQIVVTQEQGLKLQVVEKARLLTEEQMRKVMKGKTKLQQQHLLRLTLILRILVSNKLMAIQIHKRQKRHLQLMFKLLMKRPSAKQRKILILKR